MALSNANQVVCDAFATGLQRILGDNLHAVVIYGAAAFPDAVPSRDIDFHVIVQKPLTASERTALEAFHRDLAARFPPLGGELDGYYILLSDARRPVPPQSELWQRATDQSWALHCEHIRAGRQVTLVGPNPHDIYPPATWTMIDAALQHELVFAETELQAAPDYSILNLCRLIYSYETRDVVVSKASSAAWARVALPEFQEAVALAQRSYAEVLSAREKEHLVAEARRLLPVAQARIAGSRRGHAKS